MLPFKICGLTREDDVACAVGAGAWAVGFVLVEGSMRAVPAERARALAARVPDGVLTVAVVADWAIDALVALADGFGALQLHGQERPEDLALFRKRAPDVHLIKAFRPLPTGGFPDPAPYVPHVEAFLLDGPGKGEGFAPDWACPYRTLGVPWILAGGLTPETVREAAIRLGPTAVDVASGVEAMPGIKDHDRLIAFARAASAAGDGRATTG